MSLSAVDMLVPGTQYPTTVCLFGDGASLDDQSMAIPLLCYSRVAEIQSSFCSARNALGQMFGRHRGLIVENRTLMLVLIA